MPNARAAYAAKGEAPKQGGAGGAAAQGRTSPAETRPRSTGSSGHPEATGKGKAGNREASGAGNGSGQETEAQVNSAPSTLRPRQSTRTGQAAITGDRGPVPACPGSKDTPRSPPSPGIPVIPKTVQRERSFTRTVPRSAPPAGARSVQVGARSVPLSAKRDFRSPSPGPMPSSTQNPTTTQSTPCTSGVKVKQEEESQASGNPGNSKCSGESQNSGPAAPPDGIEQGSLVQGAKVPKLQPKTQSGPEKGPRSKRARGAEAVEAGAGSPKRASGAAAGSVDCAVKGKGAGSSAEGGVCKSEVEAIIAAQGSPADPRDANNMTVAADSGNSGPADVSMGFDELAGSPSSLGTVPVHDAISPALGLPTPGLVSPGGSGAGSGEVKGMGGLGAEALGGGLEMLRDVDFGDTVEMAQLGEDDVAGVWDELALDSTAMDMAQREGSQTIQEDIKPEEDVKPGMNSDAHSSPASVQASPTFGAEATLPIDTAASAAAAAAAAETRTSPAATAGTTLPEDRATLGAPGSESRDVEKVAGLPGLSDAVPAAPLKKDPSEPCQAGSEDGKTRSSCQSGSAAARQGHGGQGRKVSCEDIQLVQNLIERCLQLYMSKKEVVSTLQFQAKIEPGFTSLVWQKLEEQNQEFFQAYYMRLTLKEQMLQFNQLLEQHAAMLQGQRLPGQQSGNGSPVLNPPGYAPGANGAVAPIHPQRRTVPKRPTATGLPQVYPGLPMQPRMALGAPFQPHGAFDAALGMPSGPMAARPALGAPAGRPDARLKQQQQQAEQRKLSAKAQQQQDLGKQLQQPLQTTKQQQEQAQQQEDKGGNRDTGAGSVPMTAKLSRQQGALQYQDNAAPSSDQLPRTSPENKAGGLRAGSKPGAAAGVAAIRGTSQAAAQHRSNSSGHHESLAQENGGGLSDDSMELDERREEGGTHGPHIPNILGLHMTGLDRPEEMGAAGDLSFPFLGSSDLHGLGMGMGVGMGMPMQMHGLDGAPFASLSFPAVAPPSQQAADANKAPDDEALELGDADVGADMGGQQLSMAVAPMGATSAEASEAIRTFGNLPRNFSLSDLAADFPGVHHLDNDDDGPRFQGNLMGFHPGSPALLTSATPLFGATPDMETHGRGPPVNNAEASKFHTATRLFDDK